MRKILIALAAGGAMAAFAAPALAQYYDRDDNVAARENAISNRIDNELREGDLTYGQAARLRAELRQVERLDSRYSYDGMSVADINDLNSRLDLLDSRLNYDVSMNRSGREYGFGFYRWFGG